MKKMLLMLLLVGVGFCLSSCYVRPACGPVMIRDVQSAVPVLPTYYPRCHPGSCGAYHLPYVTRGAAITPVFPLYAPCDPCYYP